MMLSCLAAVNANHENLSRRDKAKSPPPGHKLPPGETHWTRYCQVVYPLRHNSDSCQATRFRKRLTSRRIATWTRFLTARNHPPTNCDSTRWTSSRRRAFAPTWIFIHATILIGLVPTLVASQEVTLPDSPASVTSDMDEPPPAEFVVQTDIYLQTAQTRQTNQNDRQTTATGPDQATPNDQRVSRNATYFLKDRIVDVAISESGAIESAVVLNLVSGDITLLDSARGKSCSLTYDELIQTVAAITSQLDDKPPIVQFAANPKFKVDWNEESGKLKMIAEPMEYTIHSAKQLTKNAASLYRRFADMSARLNATQPGGLPPTARLEINREIGNHDAVPTRVERTRIDRKQKAYSMHQYRLNLDAAAIANIEQVDSWSGEFETIDLVSYRLGK